MTFGFYDIVYLLHHLGKCYREKAPVIKAGWLHVLINSIKNLGEKIRTIHVILVARTVPYPKTLTKPRAVHRIPHHVTQSQTGLERSFTKDSRWPQTQTTYQRTLALPWNGRTLAPTIYKLLSDAFSKANGFPHYRIPEHPRDYALLTSVGISEHPTM